MITAVRYAEITGDTSTPASAVSAREEDAVELLEDYLDRPLDVAERTETLTPDRLGRLWPRATPISDGGDYVVDGLALVGPGPFGLSGFVNPTDSISVTYTGGWTADTLPACIERDLAWATYRLLHPEAVAPLTTIAAGATSARLGDAALTWGSGGQPAPQNTDGWWSRRTRGYRYAPLHSGPMPHRAVLQVLPLATTTGTILRPPSGDPYETPSEPAEVATGIASHVSAPTGSEVDQGGQLERIDAVLLTEADADLRHTDLWRDDGTDQTYRVAWVRLRQGLGLDHIKAGLVAYSGAATGG